MKTLTCTHCGLTKPLSGFYYHRTRHYWLHRCRTCWSEYRRALGLVQRRDKADPIIKAATAALRTFGPMTAKDIARLIGGTPRGTAQVMSKSGVFISRIPSNKESAIWSIAGHDQCADRDKKRRALAAAVRRCAAKPLLQPPPERANWCQPEHDAWYAALQAEIAARKAEQAVMRGLV